MKTKCRACGHEFDLSKVEIKDFVKYKKYNIKQCTCPNCQSRVAFIAK